MGRDFQKDFQKDFQTLARFHVSLFSIEEGLFAIHNLLL